MRRCATMAPLLHITLVALLGSPLASAANAVASSATAASVATLKGEKVEVPISSVGVALRKTPSDGVDPLHHDSIANVDRHLMRIGDEKSHMNLVRKQKTTKQHALTAHDNGHAGVLLDKKGSQAHTALEESSSAVVKLNLMPSGIGDSAWSADGEGENANVHGTVVKHTDTGVDDDGDGNDDHYYNFDGSTGYLAIEKVHFKDSKITHMVAEVRARTNKAPKSDKAWSDNWSLLDFDRSEWFNIFIRADDGKAMACSTGTAGGSEKTLDELHGGNNIADNAWHTIKYVFGKEDGHRLFVDGTEVDTHTAFSEAGDSDWVGDGMGDPGTKRFGFIGDGSEADTENGPRNNIWFEGDIKWVKLCTGTSVSACESALTPTPAPTPAPSDDKSAAHRMYSLGSVLFVLKVLLLTMHA